MGMAVGALFIRDNFNHESKVRNGSELGMAFQKTNSILQIIVSFIPYFSLLVLGILVTLVA